MQYFERSFERRSRVANRLIEPLNALHVVGKNIQWQPLQQLGKCIPVAGQIAGKQFDSHIGRAYMNCLHAAAVVACATIGLVVAVHHGDHHVVQVHPLNRVRQMLWLVDVGKFGRTERLHRTEAATAGAFLASDHKGRRSPPPAIVDVRALGFLAHSMQATIVHGTAGAIEQRQRFARRGLGAKPLWEARAGKHWQGRRVLHTNNVGGRRPMSNWLAVRGSRGG